MISNIILNGKNIVVYIFIDVIKILYKSTYISSQATIIIIIIVIINQPLLFIRGGHECSRINTRHVFHFQQDNKEPMGCRVSIQQQHTKFKIEYTQIFFFFNSCLKICLLVMFSSTKWVHACYAHLYKNIFNSIRIKKNKIKKYITTTEKKSPFCILVVNSMLYR